MGPYIKDVRTGRGEGGSPKADIVREVAWIYSYRSSQNADKGGEGVQNPKNFADVLYEWSLSGWPDGRRCDAVAPALRCLWEGLP